LDYGRKKDKIGLPWKNKLPSKTAPVPLGCTS
jgi:hypothetical protein